MEKDAFRGCTALKEVAFAEGTKEIHGWFKECDSLTDVVLPDSATSINGQPVRRTGDGQRAGRPGDDGGDLGKDRGAV